MLKKIIKIFILLVALLSAVVVVTSGWWLYDNPIVTLSQTDTGLKGAVVHKGEKKNAEYGPSQNLSSVEQVEKARNKTSQPLYLNGWLTIPDVGLERQIFEGTSDRVLSYGAGTISPNQSPDKIGTYGLAAHNYGDWGYSLGFSKLQYFNKALIGKKAYITDGNKLYTYLITNYDVVFRDDSMPFTELDWNNRDMSAQNEKYSIEKMKVKGDVSINPEDVYSNKNKDKNKTFTYGRDLVLYTCEEIPPDYLHSYNRIIVRGVQIKEEPIPNVDSETVSQFNTSIGEDGKKIVTGVNSNVIKENSNKQNPKFNKLKNKSFTDELLSINKNFINYSFYISITVLIISGILLIIIKRYF